MSVLCLVESPSGGVIELRHERGKFATRLLIPETDVVVTPEQAQQWYDMAKRCDGTICRSFPRIRRGRWGWGRD